MSNQLSKKSFSLNQETVRRLEAFFDLGSSTQIIRNLRGLLNITLMINKNRVLTVFRQRTEEQVKALIELVDKIKSPLPSVIEGKEGHIVILDGLPAIMTERVQGKHYVGLDHAEKKSMPKKAHKSVSRIFWELHQKLQAEGASLVHGDMERQNILFNSQNQVSGVVDLDAIRQGDILREFSHFLFNFVFLDPAFTPRNVDLYLEEAIRVGMIGDTEITEIYFHITEFAKTDLHEFSQLASSVKRINLSRLTAQYKQALILANNYFSHGKT